MIKYVALFAVLMAVSTAIVCPPNYCDAVDCEELTGCLESNGQKIREKGSFCQCCDICVKIIGENKSCIPATILGVVPTSECAEGLICDEHTFTCRYL